MAGATCFTTPRAKQMLTGDPCRNHPDSHERRFSGNTPVGPNAGPRAILLWLGGARHCRFSDGGHFAGTHTRPGPHHRISSQRPETRPGHLRANEPLGYANWLIVLPWHRTPAGSIEQPRGPFAGVAWSRHRGSGDEPHQRGVGDVLLVDSFPWARSKRAFGCQSHDGRPMVLAPIEHGDGGLLAAVEHGLHR